MSTGHVILWLGIGLVAAGVLLLTVGGILAASAKKSAMRRIQKEYR